MSGKWHLGLKPENGPSQRGFDRSFALLHVDVDLYRPTLQSLEFFWPRLAPGGVVVCDDYGSRKCPGARAAFDEFFADKDARLIELPTVQALVFKPG